MGFKHKKSYTIHVPESHGEIRYSSHCRRGCLCFYFFFYLSNVIFNLNVILIQRDINGFCPTSYTFLKSNGTQIVVDKVKDISECTERYHMHSIIPTSSYVFQSVSQQFFFFFVTLYSQFLTIHCQYFIGKLNQFRDF